MPTVQVVSHQNHSGSQSVSDLFLQWSIPDTPQSKRAATPVALSSPSTAPTKAAVLSPVARLTPADRRMRENEVCHGCAEGGRMQTKYD